MMSQFEETARNKVRRVPERGIYDKVTIYRIIDEALVCHVSFVQGEQPFVIPINHARDGDKLILHGAKASRLLKHIQAGNELCVAITLVDGLVLARSIFHHSVNYRSVVLYGRGEIVEDDEEKLRALELLSEHIMPGRWSDARTPNRKELNATTVVSISIESASAKIRTGPPGDEEEDYELPVWAGVLPMRQQFLDPEDDPTLRDNLPVPEYVVDYWRK